MKMPPFSSSRPHLLILLLLLLLLLGPAAAMQDADCGGAFRAGKENFVLDAEDAVREGAAFLSTAHVRSAQDCERVCCEDARCNLALLEPSGAAAPETDNATCVLFNCVHRNRFVCRFVNQAGYRSFIRESVFLKHLRGPQSEGESRGQMQDDAVRRLTVWQRLWLRLTSPDSIRQISSCKVGGGREATAM